MPSGFYHENEIDPLEVQADDALSYANLAKDWAIKMDGPVSGEGYSSQWNASLSAQSAAAAVQSANDAAAQVTLSAQWSSHPVDTVVPGTSAYSAYHWAVKAQASASTAAQAASDATQQVTLAGAVLSDVQAAGAQYLLDIAAAGDTELVSIAALGDTYLANIALAASPNATLNTDGGSFTLALVHGAKYLRLGATAVAETITVPTNAAVPFAINTDIHIANRDTQNAVLAAAGGVTINLPYLGGLNIPPGGTVSLKKVAADEWDLYGVTLP